jgi:hypothetical protein
MGGSGKAGIGLTGTLLLPWIRGSGGDEGAETPQSLPLWVIAWGESAGGHCIVPFHIPPRTSGVGARWVAGLVGVARAAPDDRRALRRALRRWGTPAVPGGRGGMYAPRQCTTGVVQ